METQLYFPIIDLQQNGYVVKSNTKKRNKTLDWTIIACLVLFSIQVSNQYFIDLNTTRICYDTLDAVYEWIRLRTRYPLPEITRIFSYRIV